MAMVSSDTPSLRGTSDCLAIPAESHANALAKYHFSTDITFFKSTRLKGFHSALFIGNSLWICGWNKSIIGSKNIVFLNVQGDYYDVLSKNKFKFPEADKSMIIFVARETIYFAKRDSYEIHSFNTKTYEFHRVFSNHDHPISSMCGNENHMYLLQKTQLDHVEILNYNFDHLERMTTGLRNIAYCDVDMCSLDRGIVIASSLPLASIRHVDPEQGILWLLETDSSPVLSWNFNPINVSLGPGGDIFFVDRGETDKVSTRLELSK